VRVWRVPLERANRLPLGLALRTGAQVVRDEFRQAPLDRLSLTAAADEERPPSSPSAPIGRLCGHCEWLRVRAQRGAVRKAASGRHDRSGGQK